MALIIFLVVLSVLILVHEAGHFFIARKNKVRVEEFGMGLPPRLFGKKFGETIYSFNLLPFGGFVKLTGEDALDGEGAKTGDKKSFLAKRPFQKIQILLAGVLMNLLLGIIIYYVFLIANGFKTFYMPLFFNYKFPFGHAKVFSTVISGYLGDSAAEMAGLGVGDAILEVNGNQVRDVYDVREAVAGKAGSEISVLVLDLKKQDENALKTVKIIPQVDMNGDSVLGVYLGESVRIEYSSFFEKVFSGVLHSYNILSYSLSSFGKIISTSIKSRDITPVSQSVSGPVGIYNIVQNILTSTGSKAFLSILDFVALMSLTLAFINAIPFPALDGGRVFFILVSALTRREVSPRFEAGMHKLGMLILLGLLVLITAKDIFL